MAAFKGSRNASGKAFWFEWEKHHNSVKLELCAMGQKMTCILLLH